MKIKNAANLYRGAWRLLALFGLMLHTLPAAGQQAPANIADAEPGEIRLLISNALRLPFEAVRAEAGRKLGAPLVIEYANSRTLQAKIETGQPFEAAVLTREVIDDMIAKDWIRPGSRADIGQIPVSVFQRGDVPDHAVDTPEALKTTLLGAASIKLMATGAAGPTIERAFAELGVAETLQDRISPLAGAGVRTVTLAPGQYELIITLASEFDRASGRTYLGRIPDRFQVPVVISAGVGTKGDPRAAAAFVGFLMSRAVEPALHAHHITR